MNPTADHRLTLAHDDHGVTTIEFERGEANYFDYALISDIARALEQAAHDGRTRAVVLCSVGKHFCAGADFGSPEATYEAGGHHLYDAAVRLFDQPLPIVAAVQGAAVGGGLGLALAADFRVAARDARFWAPFARLGVTQGFGLTVTLPRVVGEQRAAELLLTARRISADEAQDMGLVDEITETAFVRERAHRLAAVIASNAPLATREIRSLLRADLAPAVREATRNERRRQDVLQATSDHREGVAASLARRTPRFAGR
ncbi:enoyl-CoA hydratase/isomerase family protein [Aeromicrobium phragmitis]|uniref:Enoyl-CoA hydratase/isomerase family protein n=1 Tax=Aeromicrobium phragmitis TaxID=2478914 RepID=A0A3L8PPT3_9ACTN|nr:enoyl-CoA hydratase/isomerase family protein [Aeromicrobium phragmitis]RLV57381.1 enoyl-CoA hydratase/isomerase family protein [Aeromicrobium phragmitis]